MYFSPPQRPRSTLRATAMGPWPPAPPVQSGGGVSSWLPSSIKPKRGSTSSSHPPKSCTTKGKAGQQPRGNWFLVLSCMLRGVGGSAWGRLFFSRTPLPPVGGGGGHGLWPPSLPSWGSIGAFPNLPTPSRPSGSPCGSALAVSVSLSSSPGRHKGGLLPYGRLGFSIHSSFPPPPPSRETSTRVEVSQRGAISPLSSSPTPPRFLPPRPPLLLLPAGRPLSYPLAPGRPGRRPSHPPTHPPTHPASRGMPKPDGPFSSHRNVVLSQEEPPPRSF